MRLRVKLHADRLNHFRDMTIFRLFKMAAVRHLGFVKVKF